MATRDDILRHFTDVRQKDADHWTATCPNCQKRRQLWITEGKMTAFVQCRGSCDTDLILSAAGLTRESLRFPRRSEPDDLRSAPGERRLEDRHRLELEGSAISETILVDMGAWTCNHAADLRKLGFSEGQARCVPCLVFPSHTPDGQALYQIKPDRPFRDAQGKPVKYLSPVGGDYGLGVLPAARAELFDASRPLWITEGLKKAASALSHGMCCISLSGVWMWQRKDKKTGKHIPLPDWDSIPLDGRLVYIAFDSDAMTKESVYLALKELLQFLNSRGAITRVVHFPDGPHGEKCGLDDYFAAGHDAGDVYLLGEETLRPMVTELSQEVVKALQKRTRGSATFTANGVTLSSINEKNLKRAGYAARAIESETKSVLFWSWGDLYIAACEIMPFKERTRTFTKWFGPDVARRAAEAATTCRIFPASQRRTGIPPFVYQEIGTADEAKRKQILDIYEEKRMTREEIRREVRQSKDLPARPPVTHERESLKDRETADAVPRRLREILEIIPVERRVAFRDALREFGWDEELEDWIRRKTLVLQARKAAENSRESGYSDDTEKDRFDLATSPPAGKLSPENESDFLSQSRLPEEAASIASTSPPYIEEEGVPLYSLESVPEDASSVDRRELARKRWPRLMTAIESHVIPHNTNSCTPFQISPEWTVDSLRSAARWTLEDFIRLDRFSPEEASEHMSQIESAVLSVCPHLAAQPAGASAGSGGLPSPI